jgi:hypothetical protein
VPTPWPFELAPLSPPLADDNARSLCAWVFDGWSGWTKSDGPDERPLNGDELIVIRSAVERIAWFGVRIH